MWQPIFDVPPVTALMDSAQTQLANNNLVTLRIVLFKADITDDVVFNQVLITLDLSIGVCLLKLQYLMFRLFLNFWSHTFPNHPLHELCLSELTDLFNF
jgi:hypothetical protein